MNEIENGASKKNALKSLYKSLGAYDIAVLSVVFITELLIIIFYKDSWVGAVASVTGVIGSLLSAKMNRMTFIFGTINCITYAAVGFESGLYGAACMSVLVYLPLQISGFFMWKKHTVGDTLVVKKLKKTQLAAVITVLTAVSAAVGFLLCNIESENTPFIDAFSSVFSTAAALFVVLRYREQSALYFVTNTLLLIMWALRFDISNGEVLSIILLRAMFLSNNVVGYIMWYRASRNNIK